MKMIDSVYFHEDDYCQIELLPIRNLLSKQDDESDNIEWTEQYLLEYNFTNIYRRNQSIPVLSELNIKLCDFEDIAKKDALFLYREVYSGYSNARFLQENICGLGFENYILYYEWMGAEITRCWLKYHLISDTLNLYPHSLQTTLFNLGFTYDLFLMDWNEFRMIILKNNELLKRYIEEVFRN